MQTDPSRHLPTDVLERQLRGLREPRGGGGMVRLVVVRGPQGRHTPSRARFTRQGGLDGDRWATRGDRRRRAR